MATPTFPNPCPSHNGASTCKIMIFCCFGLMCSALQLPADVVVSVYPSIGIHDAQFDIHQWNSHHGVSDQAIPLELLSIGTRPGRWLKPDANLFALIPEDSKRPGFANLSWFKTSIDMAKLTAEYTAAANLVGKDKYDLILCFAGDEWPTYLGWTQNKSSIPTNVDGAAEVIVAFVTELYKASDGILPKYIEPVNEPNGNGISCCANTTLINNYQRTVAAALTTYLDTINMSDATMVGGPAMAGISFAHNKYRGLDDLFWGSQQQQQPPQRQRRSLPHHQQQQPPPPPQQQLVHQQQPQQQQFVSFHVFDGYDILPNHTALKVRHAGGPIAAAFDAVESQALINFGHLIPILVSEHGLATNGNPRISKVVSLTSEQTGQIDSFWGQFFSVFERRDNLLAMSSFLIDNTYAFEFNPSVSLTNTTNANATTNDPTVATNATNIVTTIVANATFGLLQRLDGLKLVHSNVEHIQHEQRVMSQAWSSPEFTFVLLKNLKVDSVLVNVSMASCSPTTTTPPLSSMSSTSSPSSPATSFTTPPPSSISSPSSPTTTTSPTIIAIRVFVDDDGLTRIHDTVVTATELRSLLLNPQELCMLKVMCSATISSELIRGRDYAKDSRIEIGKSGVVNTTIIVVPLGSLVQSMSAVLRVSYAEDYSNNATTAFSPPSVPTPHVTFNGVALILPPLTLRIDNTVAPEANHWFGQWRSWEYQVPQHLITTAIAEDNAVNTANTVNTVQIVFTPVPATTGSVSAVCLESYHAVAVG